MNLQTATERDAIIQRCHELGFALAGVCEALPIQRPEAYLAWLDAGRHGEMSYMARNVELRIDPRALLPAARSIICVADRYHIEPVRDSDDEADDDGESRSGRIARYARGDDYHTVMKKRLIALCDELRAQHPDEAFRACVDTAPVMEREHAERAGLGSIGKHTLLIELGVGSYLLLGEIITTLGIEPSAPSTRDPCGSCTRCIDACPTDAITPWSVDATRCISYLTIEHRSAIAPKYHEAMGEWIFGCDICQEVCPHNQPTETKQDAAVHAAYAPRREHIEPSEVLAWSEDDRRAAFRNSAMKRAKLDMMKRNAAIVQRNLRVRRPAD